MTTIKLIIALFLVALPLCPAAFAESRRCILPAPDYRPPDTSDPSLRGNITRIQPDALTIETLSDRANHETPVQYRIRINEETSTFTSFGGYVAQKSLRIGERVNVWYVGCDSKKAGSPPIAAVIEVVR